MKDLSEYPAGCFNYHDGSVHHSNERCTRYMIHFDEDGKPFESDAYSLFITPEQIKNQTVKKLGPFFAIKGITFEVDHQFMLMSKRRWDRLYIYAKEPDKEKN